MEQKQERLGLRERKKREMRQRIQSVAADLFSARGFDSVTVTEVARAADVSQATVFNYFPTKEDLIFHGMSEYGRHLVATLRDRAPGTPILDAFRQDLVEPRGVLADDDPDAMAGLLRTRRIIAGSPALQAREHLIADATAVELAELIAEGPPAGVQPWFLATAMAGLIQAMTREIHRLAADGLSGAEIGAIVLPQGADAVDLLARGLSASATARPRRAARAR